MESYSETPLPEHEREAAQEQVFVFENELFHEGYFGKAGIWEEDKVMCALMSLKSLMYCIEEIYSLMFKPNIYRLISVH